MRKLFLAGALLALGAANATAATFSVTGTGSGGQTISAEAIFTFDGTNLKIVLTNTAPAAAKDNANLLSGLFFNIDGAGAVTAVGGSATATDGLLQSDQSVTGAGSSLNDFWSFNTNRTLGPNTYEFGLGGAGFGIFGADTFTHWQPGGCASGAPCQGEPDGPPYLIAPSGGTTGVPAPQFPLTSHLATFLLPITTAFDLEKINGVTFTWGTRPEYRGTDGSPGDGGGGLDGSTNTPEPATLALFGLALAAGATQLRRRNKK